MGLPKQKETPPKVENSQRGKPNHGAETFERINNRSKPTPGEDGMGEVILVVVMFEQLEVVDEQLVTAASCSMGALHDPLKRRSTSSAPPWGPPPLPPVSH